MVINLIEDDTIELLKECNSGVKMGIASIKEVINQVENNEFKNLLEMSINRHQKLGDETRKVLNRYDDTGEQPNAMAKSMSWMKTNIKMAISPTDETISDLITDGCNMGVKSLNKYLNEYEAASEEAKDIAKKLINEEENLARDIRRYL